MVCEVIYAELASQFPTRSELDDFLSQNGFEAGPHRYGSLVYGQYGMAGLYIQKAPVSAMAYFPTLRLEPSP